MSGIGPELPPHLLARRKRQREESSAEEATTSPGAKRPKSPSTTTTITTTSPDEKRPRTIGPAAPSAIGPTPPPAPLEERPTGSPDRTIPQDSDDESSSDDDDFGPAPASAADAQRLADEEEDRIARLSRPDSDDKPRKVVRDEWMMVPPSADDLSTRLDPLKPRPRGFASGKGARAPKGPAGGAMDVSWTETREEKLRRLQNEAMGVQAPDIGENFDAREYAKRKDQEEQAKRAKEHTEKNRGKSLMEQHTKVNKVEEDDPSKRAFDREKDIGGRSIGGVQRKEMLRKAGDFSSKFAGGNFL